MLELHFDPDLADVCAAFFPAEKSVVKQSGGAGEIAGLGFVESEVVDKGKRHRFWIGIPFEDLHALGGGLAEDGEGGDCAGIIDGVFRIVGDSVLKNSKGFFGVVSFVEERPAEACFERGDFCMKIACGVPFAESGGCHGAGKEKRAEEVVGGRVVWVGAESGLEGGAVFVGAGEDVES